MMHEFPQIAIEPIHRMLCRERNINDGSPNLRSFTHSTSTATHPRYGLPAFPLPWLPVERLEIGSWGTSDPIPAGLPVHPDWAWTMQDASISGSWTYSWAVPTASGRTVVLCESGVQVKLGYPGVLGRFPRPLTETKLRHCMQVSKELRDFDDLSHFEEGFALLPRAKEHSELGVIFRSALPTGVRSHSPEFFPLCSLAARWTDPKGSVWRELASAIGRWCAPSEVAAEIVQSFIRIVETAGVIPEPHAQNIVLTVDDGRLLVTWRDLQGFAKFPQQKESISQILSLRYDWYLGHYVLAPLGLWAREWGSTDQAFRSSVLDAFDQVQGTHCQNLPSGHWEMPLSPVEAGRRIEPIYYSESHEWRTR